MTTKPKPRLGVMLRQSFEESPNQCAELDALKERYKKMNQNMTSLGKALKQRHASLVNTGKSRAAVADALYAMSESTPVQDSAQVERDQMKKLSETSLERADEFKTFAMDYFQEWQEKVNTRIQKDTKVTDQLRRDADHYQAKVTSLEQGVKKLTDAKKTVPPAKTEQLQRNQEKLREANQLYETAARDLFLLMEELVDRSWRDLHPLLLKLLNFDVKNVKEEQSLDMEKALQNLKQLKAKDDEIPESTENNRLGRLEQATPQELGQLAPDGSSTAPSTPFSNNNNNSSNNNNSDPSPSPSSNQLKKPDENNTNKDNENQPKKSWFNRNNNKKKQELLESDDSSVDDKKSSSSSAPPPPPSPETEERKSQPHDTTKKLPESKTNPFDGAPESKANPFDDDDNNNNPNGSSSKDNKNPWGDNNKKKSAPAAAASASNPKSTPKTNKPTPSSNKAKPLGRRPSNSSSSSSSADSPPPPTKKKPVSSAVSRGAAPTTPQTVSKKAAVAPPPPLKPPMSPGKAAKVQQHPDHDEKSDPYEGADPSKWRTKQMIFGGSFTYETKGESEEVVGSSIKEGIEKFKADPKKYVCLFHQSNMLDWPTDKQRYIMIHREGTSGYTPQNVGKGPMTLYYHSYERLPSFPNDELPMQYRDKYTDHMTHQGRKLHSANNLPMLPGRGMGICDTPNLKIIGDVDPSDIHQGTVGDCWLLSGISSLAEFDGAVKKLFRKTKNLDQRPLDGPNMYIVTLWDLETWTERDIQIDERLPVMADGSRKLLASKPSEDGELWVCYLEKALAVHCGGWDKITGGQCTHAWSLLTGCKEQYTIRRNDKTKKFQCFGKFDPNKKQWLRHANCPHDGDQVTWPMDWPKVGGGEDLHTEMTEEEVFQKLCAWDQENYIIGAGCQSKAGDKGLVSDHAYSVIECLNDVAGTDIDLIKVRNPWGSGEIEDGMFDDDGPGWTKYPQIKKLLNPVVANDGIFWVTKEEFFKFFATIYLSASNMTEFLED